MKQVNYTIEKLILKGELDCSWVLRRQGNEPVALTEIKMFALLSRRENGKAKKKVGGLVNRTMVHLKNW